VRQGGRWRSASLCGNGQRLAGLLLHGNGAMVEDMLISGVIEHAAPVFRVISFNRSGCGHSERPRYRSWTAAAQAALFARTFDQTGHRRADRDRPLKQYVRRAGPYPQSSGIRERSCAGLGLLFPTARSDVALFSPIRRGS
jgi:hypothetical protein